MNRTKEWLIEQRKKVKLTQKQFADQCGINLSTLQNIEQGKRNGSPETWNKIENYINENNLKNKNIDKKDLEENLKLVDENLKRIMNIIEDGKTGEYEIKCICGGTLNIKVKEGKFLGGTAFISCKCNLCGFSLIT